MNRAVFEGRAGALSKAVILRAAVILLALATALVLLAMVGAGAVAAQVVPTAAHDHHGLIKAPLATPRAPHLPWPRRRTLWAYPPPRPRTMPSTPPTSRGCPGPRLRHRRQ